MLVAFSVTPLGTGEAVGEVVAEAVRVVRESGLPNQTDAMFTTIEGDWDETMAVVKRAVQHIDHIEPTRSYHSSHSAPIGHLTRPEAA